MPVTRRFLLASPFARLVHKELGSEGVTEGHFVPQAERQSHVRIEAGRSHLVLTSFGVGPEAADDVTDLPTSHAEALLEVAAGRVEFRRARLPLGGRHVLVDRLTLPGMLDTVSVEFETPDHAAAFDLPVWFGAEVSDDDRYARRSIALSGLPQGPEVVVSDAALDALLDAIEGLGAGASPDLPAPAVETGAGEDSTFDALRRLAGWPKEPETAAAAAASEGDDGRKARRPMMRPRPDTNGADERLASVLDGLSEALGKTTPDLPAQAAL
jgi:CYTH domain-containing protein